MTIRLAIPLAAVLLVLLNYQWTHAPSMTSSTLTGNSLLKSVTSVDIGPNQVASLPPSVSQGGFAQAINRGNPIQIAVGDEQPRHYIFRPRRAVADGFAFALGVGGGTLNEQPQVFEGINAKPEYGQEQASLVLIGDTLSAVIREANGITVYVRQDPSSGALQARREYFGDLGTHCTIEPETGISIMRSDDHLSSSDDLWADAEVATIEVAALTGIDPATGDLDKYLNPIPRATAYDASLKDALMLLVLDKDATGSGTAANLKSVASLYLATISNVAAVYENQLGIRLLVSEMIMIPDESSYNDIPNGDVIDDFRIWTNDNRRRSTYRWSMAAKYGDGLSGTTLGVAFVGEIGSTSAVSVSRTSAIWDVIAHEMGHNLGSGHSQGGIMNASSTNGNTRSFFTNVNTGETSAKDIYDYARNRLIGPASMRHPEQIPFAQRDYRMTPVNQVLRLSPLDNDDVSVANGEINALAVEEVGAVTPLTAGTVAITGEQVVFTPGKDFVGTAWFSYTIRGSVGNSGNGWLHKGDVAIDVGQFNEPATITLAPGASYSFIPTSTSGLTQPDHALVSRSRDDRDLLIIRVDADASGVDTFRSGGRTFTLNYIDSSPVVTDDFYIYDAISGPLRFNPLLNDEGAGEFWVNPIKPTIGVGTAGHDNSGEELFSTTFRLVNATNLTPEKGDLITSLRSFVINGSRNNRLDSTLTFSPLSGASGIATIEYTVEDATGTQATGLAEIVLPFRVDRLVDTGDMVRFLVPNSDAVDSRWMLPDFDDGNWTPAATGLGYDNASDFLPEIVSTIPGLGGVNTSLFVRLPFTVNSALQYDQLSLRLKIDDGFIAYLNGKEIARSSNAPNGAPLPWNAQAIGSTVDSQALQFAAFDISDMRDKLREGENVLAIHGLNATLNSSDFLLVPEIDGAVTSSSVLVVSPTAEAVSVPVGTGLMLEAQANGAVAGGSVTWVQVSGPVNGANFESAQALQTAVTFFSPGEYRLRITSVAGTQSSSAEVDVIVAEAPTDLSGVQVSLGEDRSVTGLVASVSGKLSQPAVDNIAWNQVSGADSVIFSSPKSLTTEVGFISGGAYGLRLVVENDGIRTFDDIVISASVSQDSGLSALVQPVTRIQSDSVTLNGAAFFAGEPAIATYFLGLTDAGDNDTAWEYALPLGSQGSGNLQVVADNLLFAGTYYYRLQLQRRDEVAWSEAGQFTTAPAPRLSEVLVVEGASARVFVPTDASVDGAWLEPTFDDSAWINGTAKVGFDLDGDYAPLIQTDIQQQMFEQSTSVYVRVPFGMTAREGVEELTLRMRYDDAFIAHLNGVEIARSATAPQEGPVSWQTAAAILREDNDAVVFKDFDLSHRTDLLVNGTNVLSIHGLNFIVENRDLLVSPQLEATRSQTYYEQWLATHTDLAAGSQDLLANPDGDGFNNLQEYALGGNPFQTEPISQLTPHVVTGDTGQTELSFQRRADLDVRGVGVLLESSMDLIEWAPMPLETFTASRVSNGVQRVAVPLAVTNPVNFWRLSLRVSINDSP